LLPPPPLLLLLFSLTAAAAAAAHLVHFHACFAHRAVSAEVLHLHPPAGTQCSRAGSSISSKVNFLSIMLQAVDGA
jgi:hypothetical protein